MPGRERAGYSLRMRLITENRNRPTTAASTTKYNTISAGEPATVALNGARIRSSADGSGSV